MQNVLKVLVLSYVLLFVTGCMDFNAEMEIKANKNMILTFTEMVDNNYSSDSVKYFTDSDIAKYKENGFTISNVTVDDRVGHVLTKKITNIDSVSSTEQVPSKDATKALLGESKYIFNVKRGILRNKYYATFNMSDFVDSIGTDFSDTSYRDISFKLRLPYKVITSDATNVSKNGKVLEWNLNDLNTQQIYFEFYLFNLTNIYILGGGILLVGLLIFSEYRDKKIAQSFYKRK